MRRHGKPGRPLSPIQRQIFPMSPPSAQASAPSASPHAPSWEGYGYGLIGVLVFAL